MDFWITCYLELQIPNRALSPKHGKICQTHFVPWLLSQGWKYANIINVKYNGIESPLMYKTSCYLLSMEYLICFSNSEEETIALILQRRILKLRLVKRHVQDHTKWGRLYSEAELPDPRVRILFVTFCDLGRAPKFCLLRSLSKVQLQSSHSCGQVPKCLQVTSMFMEI